MSDVIEEQDVIEKQETVEVKIWKYHNGSWESVVEDWPVKKNSSQDILIGMGYSMLAQSSTKRTYGSFSVELWRNKERYIIRPLTSSCALGVIAMDTLPELIDVLDKLNNIKLLFNGE